MSRWLDRCIGALGLAALALIAALVALSLHTAAELREDVADLEHARDLQLRAQDVAVTLLRLETGQRGYVLTLDPAHLEAYRAGLVPLEREFARLAAAAHRAEESAEIERLRGLIDAQRKELARTIDVATRHGVAAALAALRDSRGPAGSDDIRAALERLGRQAAAAHSQRHAVAMARMQRNERLAVLLSVVLALLLLALIMLLRRDRSAQALSRADDAHLRQQLQQRVSDRTTELQATHGRLMLSEDRLRRVFESASEGILTADSSQVIVEANAACAEMFRCEVSDLIGTRLDRLIPARYHDAHRRHVEAFGVGAVRSRRMHGADGGREVTALRLDGTEFPIEASISRTDIDGERLYTVIHRDLTERRRAAAALRDSQQLMAATFDASSVAMAQIDPATCQFVAVNAALCELSGFTEAELLSMGPRDLAHADDPFDEASFQALARTGTPYRADKRLIRKDGRVVWVDVAGSIVRDAAGRPARLVGIVQDITPRRQADAELRRREERQSFIVRLNDRLRDLHDPQAIACEAARLLGEFVRADRVGYAQDDGNGHSRTVWSHDTRGEPPADGGGRPSAWAEPLQAALRAGRTVVRPDIATDPSLSDADKAALARQQLAADVSVPLMRNARLHATLFVHSATARAWQGEEVSLFEDVAQRVRAEVDRASAQAAARVAVAKLEAAIDSMNDAVYISDATGQPVQFNDAFVAFHRFGHRDEALKPLDEYARAFDVVLPDGTPAPLPQWPVSRALRGETGSNVEYRVRRKDTGESWVASYSFAPIRADDGSIVGAVFSGRDITRLQKTQEDLAISHAALRHLVANQQRVQEEERKRIARELHDDLQQSLAAIRMDAVAIGGRLAKGRSDVAPLLARIDRLAGAAIDSSRRIVSDLRPEMLEELGLLPALEALCEEHAQRSGAQCRFEGPATHRAAQLDDTVLSVALFRIAQEALNNAAKHAKASAVKVDLDVSENGLVTLRVSDNGVGIGERESRDPQSFGLLGMAERVRAMGGQLRIQGNGGRGTVVEVLVPVLDPGAAATRPAGAEPATPIDGDELPQGLAVWDVWGRPLQAVIDALDGHVAVLGRDGAIQLVNRAWREFAASHGDPGLIRCGPGVNYLAVCRRSAASEPSAALALRGLSAVLAGQDESFSLEYACDTTAGRRGFRIHAATMTGGLAIVSHVEVGQAAAPAGPADADADMPAP